MNTQTYKPNALETVTANDRTLRRILATNARKINEAGVAAYVTVEEGDMVFEYYTDAYEAAVFIDYNKGTYDVDWYEGDYDRLIEQVVADWAKLVVIIKSELK